jgi:hypothetical protein
MLCERNRLTFALRRLSAWEIGAYREKAEPKAGLFKDDPAAQAEAARLLAAYDLFEPWVRATKTRYRETLTYLLWLETLRNLAPVWFEQTLFPIQPVNSLPHSDESVEPFRWLDAGAKNWSYAAAIPAFLMKESISDFALDGVELDPYRRYADLRTRGQAARAHIRAIPQARYHEGDVRDWTRSARIITSFLPFVFPEPHLAWGLPASDFRPFDLLKALLSLLEPGGLLLIVNQGEAEAEEQAALLSRVAERFPIAWQTAGQLPAPFIQYRYPRYGWICRKNE